MSFVKGWVYAGLRALVQAFWGYLLSKPIIGVLLASVPDDQRNAFEVALATFLTAAIIGLFVSGVRWLETRTGYAIGPKIARAVAAFLMLGLSKFQPVYAPSMPTTVAVSVNTERPRGSIEGPSPVRVPSLTE